MASFDDNRIENRRSAQLQQQEGTTIRPLPVNASPPGPWQVAPGVWDAYERYWDNGFTVVRYVNRNGVRYAQLYTWVEQPGDAPADEIWLAWKRVDVDFPKIDPRTGEPFDQYLEWYSPLAE